MGGKDKSAVVLLSGGQDSTTCLYWQRDRAHVEGGRTLAIAFDYGQRHHRELEAARKIAAQAGVPFQLLNIEAAMADLHPDSALVGEGAASRPLTADGGAADVHAPNGLPSSFVPGRNLLFMAFAASYAVARGISRVVTGVCQTDFSGYPDCRREFVDAMERAASLAMPSSAGPIVIDTPLMYMTKAESVRLAETLPGCMAALAHSVTCYEGKRPGCGVCPACVLRARGFAECGLVDPSTIG